MRYCTNCKFAEQGPPPHCRRYPPKVMDDNRVTFPVVKPGWRCGEHRFSWLRLFGLKAKIKEPLPQEPTS